MRKTLFPKDLIILAGGLGTRLKEMVNNVPKPMADINGHPFLKYQLEYWVGAGIETFHILIGYKGDIIKEYFGKKFMSSEIKYYHENEPLDTGGALKNFFLNFENAPKNISLINGDTWLNIDFVKLNSDLSEINNPITIVGLEIDMNDRYGSILLDNLNVKDFGSPTNQKDKINGGLYIFDTFFLKNYLENSNSNKFSLEKKVIPDLVKQNKVSFSNSILKFIDIGIPNDLIKFRKLYKNKF